MGEQIVAGEKFRLEWSKGERSLAITIRDNLTTLDAFQICGEIAARGSEVQSLEDIGILLIATDIDEESQDVIEIFSRMFLYLAQKWGLWKLTYFLPENESGRALKAILLSHHMSKDKSGLITYHLKPMPKE